MGRILIRDMASRIGSAVIVGGGMELLRHRADMADRVILRDLIPFSNRKGGQLCKHVAAIDQVLLSLAFLSLARAPNLRVPQPT